jgi:hypothetical protein
LNVPPGNDDDLLAPPDVTKFRSVVGTVGFIESALRPDLSFEASSLSRSFLKHTIMDSKRANAAVTYAQANRLILSFEPGAKRICVYHDAAFGNLPNGKSQGGRIVALTDDEGSKVAAWIFWEVRSVKRVFRSPNAAEILSANEAYDTGAWLSHL